jgi:UPF0716 protein FxsA
MGFRGRLLVFGYPLAECAAAWLVAMWLGWGLTICLLILGIPVGLGIMRSAGAATLREVHSSVTHARPVHPGPAVMLLGGLLVAIPGLLTDVVGLVLILPPTRRLAIAWGGVWLTTRAMSVRMPGVSPFDVRAAGDVVQGQVIPPDSPPSAPDAEDGDTRALGR